VRHEPFEQLALVRSEGALLGTSAYVEGGTKILLRCQRDHPVMRDILRPQNLVVESRLAQHGGVDGFIGKDHATDPLMLHVLRPHIVHVPFLVDAVALLVEAAVEVEIDAACGEGLAEQDSALASGQVCDLSENGAPQFFFGRSVIDQIENVFRLLV
jgi:hypothetical protein